MKKIFTILLLSILTITMIGCEQDYDTTTEPYTLSFDFFDNHLFDLDDGVYTENTNYATSNRQRVYSDQITVSDYTKISYMLFWTQTNSYIGYYTLDGEDDTKDGYLGDVSSNTITFPDNTFYISVQVNKLGEDGYYKYNSSQYLSYTYSEIATLDGQYVLESIDDEIDGYVGLTYRDVFGDSLFGTGKTNLIDNGQFNYGTSADVNITSPYGIKYITGEGKYRYEVNTLSSSARWEISNIWIQDKDYYISYEYYMKYSTWTRNSFADGSYEVVADTPTGEWLNYSGITNSGSFSSNKFYMFHNTSTTYSVGDYTYYLDNLIVLYLTDLFDGYTLPTASEMDDLVAEYERLNQFGDGEITLSDITTTSMGQIENPTYDSGNWTNTLSDFATEGIDYYSIQNEISNGNFTTNLVGWNFSTTDSDGYVIWNDGRVEISSYMGVNKYIAQSGVLNPTDIYYNRFEAEINSGYIYSEGFTSEINLSSSGVYSIIKTSDTSGYVLKRGPSIETEFYVDNISLFLLKGLGYFPELYPNLTSYGTFDTDTNTDGVADGWTTGEMTNCSIAGDEQYCEATSNYGQHYLQTTITDNYTIGDTYHIDLQLTDVSTEYVRILVQQRVGPSTWSTISSEIVNPATGIDYSTDATTTSSYSTKQIRVTVYLLNSSGTELYTGSTETIAIDNFEIYNYKDESFSDMKSWLDDQLDVFNYIDGTWNLPDVTDTDFTDNYLVAYVDDGMVLGNTVMYYSNDSLGLLFDSTFNETNYTSMLQYFYDDTYNSTTDYSYGDNYDTLYIVNPTNYYELMGTTLTLLADTERDNILDLYYDYMNGVDRYEWYIEYGITESMYDDFIDEWAIQNTPESAISLTTLQTVSYNGTRTVNDYAQAPIDDVINDGLDGVGASGLDGTIIYTTVLFVVLVLTVGGLIFVKAPVSIIVFSVILELFGFYVLGWVGSWILLVLGIVLFVSVLYIIISKKGG